MISRIVKLISILIIWCFTCNAQSADPFKIKEFRQKNEELLMDEFVSFLSIPNLASDSINIRRNADFISQMMMKRGIGNVQLLNGKNSGSPPVVFGEVIVPNAKQTIIFYAHYDGQPVNPAQWAKGLEPFTPKLYNGSILNGGTNIPFPSKGQYEAEWRIYARAASDDKAGVFTILNAYQAIKEAGILPGSNLKFFFEGEEEAGSTHLGDILEKHKELLGSDLWIICDGPVHQSGKKQIVFGVRGDAHLDLTVFGPKRPLHSGHYGNWASNPAMQLVKLLATMKDDSGRVTIKGFYDDVKPLSPVELKALKEVPGVELQMQEELGLASSELPGKSLAEAIILPSLNINGIQSGNVGKQASNQIPTFATAVIDLRLVLGNDWKRQQQKVVDHIISKGYHVLDRDPTDEERRKYPNLIKVIRGESSYNAQRTSMSLPIIEKVRRAVQSTSIDPLVLLPTSGGSLPLFLFEKYLNANTITVPIANHDNNQHAENENIRIKNLWNGIETMAAVMTMK